MKNQSGNGEIKERAKQKILNYNIHMCSLNENNRCSKKGTRNPEMCTLNTTTNRCNKIKKKPVPKKQKSPKAITPTPKKTTSPKARTPKASRTYKNTP